MSKAASVAFLTVLSLLALAVFAQSTLAAEPSFCGVEGCVLNIDGITYKDTDCDTQPEPADQFLCRPGVATADSNFDKVCDACEQVTSGPQYSIIKRVGGNTIASGESVIYTIEVRNNGGAGAPITLTDSFTNMPTINLGTGNVRFFSQSRSFPPGVTVTGDVTTGMTISGLSATTGPLTISYNIVATATSTTTFTNTARLSTGQSSSTTLTITGTQNPPPPPPAGTFCGATTCTITIDQITYNDNDCDAQPEPADQFLCRPGRATTDSNFNNICDACEQTTCTPQCTGKCGGPNGCGGTCANTCSTGQTCSPQTYTCVGTCTPSNGGIEICDNRDNDCDGLIDEGNMCSSPSPQYTVAKQVLSTGPFRDGDVITYRITLNNRNDASGSFTLLDTMSGSGAIVVPSASIVYEPASQVISNRNSATTATGSINNAGGITVTNLRAQHGPLYVTYQGKVRAPNLFTNTVTASNTAQLSTGATAQASVSIAGKTPTNALTLTKAVSNTNPADNEIITYTLTVRNTNSVPVSSATIYDTIGDNLGTMTGNRGGTVSFLGTETVTGNTNNQPYTQAYTGSIASTRGITLTDIPANGLVTIRYQARVSTASIGSGVTSTISNVASIAGMTSATARVTLTGRYVPPNNPGVNDPPFILPIPNQVQICGIGFASLDLDDFIGDPETPNSQLLVSVDGNRILQPVLNPTTHILTVTDPTGVQNNIQDSVRITVRDPEGRTATRTITYSVLRNTFGQPIMSGLPDQIIRKGKNFDSFDLDTYTHIGGTPVANQTLDYYVTGSSLFEVVIDDSNNVRIDYEEDLFKFTDADQISEQLTFTVRGCNEAKDTAVFTVVREYPGAYDPYYNEYQSGGTTTRVCRLVPAPGVSLPDKDCDGVPDSDDNCIDVQNPDQRDDNKNRVGDVCDIIAACQPSLSTDLTGGTTLSVLVAAQNNANVQTTTTKYAVSIDKLGLRDTRTMGGLARGENGEANLRLRIPECVTSGAYFLTCSVQAAGHTAETRVPIDIQAGDCSSPGGDSSATIFQTQDVIAGSEFGASYPIVINNDDAVQRSYVMSVDGILPWGDYVFESGGVVIVPAGQSTTTNLRVFAYSETMPGSYPFKVIMKSGDDQQETYLRANVQPSEVLPGERNGVRLTDVVWLFILLIVLGLIIFGAYHAGKGKR